MSAPLPAPGEVVIFSASLAVSAEELQRLNSLLSPDERLRASRLLDPGVRDRFIAGRGFLRETLASFLGEKPEELRLAAGEKGKPYLEGEREGRLRFNISHSVGTALLAVAADREVGIDVEAVGGDAPFREMALRFFAPRERERLFTLPDAEVPSAFYRCWTRKEAYLKGCGAGFTVRSDSFEVTLLPGERPALIASVTSPDAPHRWFLQDIPAPEGFIAALATEGPAVVRLG